MKNDAQYYVAQFNMLPHPEGGWYKETYRAAESVLRPNLPDRFTGNRNFSTAIYFLLESHHFSAFHRIKSDELWHFYEGVPLHIYVIDIEGGFEVIKLGRDIANGEHYQAVVKAGCWFASQPAQPDSFSLVGCTVAPGFDFADFEMAKASVLTKKYPQYTEWIEMLCKE